MEAVFADIVSGTVKGRTRCRIHRGAARTDAPLTSNDGNFRYGEHSRAIILFIRTCKGIWEATRILLKEL